MERLSDEFLCVALKLCDENSVVRVPQDCLRAMIAELKEHRDLERANDELLAMSLHAMGDE